MSAVFLPVLSLNIRALIAQKIESNADCSWHGPTAQRHYDALRPSLLFLLTIFFLILQPPSPTPCHSPVTVAMPLVTAHCPLPVEAVECRDVPKFNLVMLRHRFLPPPIHQLSCLWTIMICVWASLCAHCIPVHIIVVAPLTCKSNTDYFHLFYASVSGVWIKNWMCPVGIVRFILILEMLIPGKFKNECWIFIE